MSLPIHVDAFSGYKAHEYPIRFYVDEEVCEIEAIEHRWQDTNARYFLVRTRDQKEYLLRYDEHADEWTLTGGYDSADLLARPSIELIIVDSKTIREAISRIAGCELCRGIEAHLPFDWILEEVTGKHGPYEFMMSEPAQCPSCSAAVTEKTFVEPQGGIEVETAP